jgi:hypothetical protein
LDKHQAIASASPSIEPSKPVMMWKSQYATALGGILLFFRWHNLLNTYLINAVFAF